MLRANFDSTIVFHSHIEKGKENEKLFKHNVVLQIILFYRYKGIYWNLKF